MYRSVDFTGFELGEGITSRFSSKILLKNAKYAIIKPTLRHPKPGQPAFTNQSR
jgi:hypothetical protein